MENNDAILLQLQQNILLSGNVMLVLCGIPGSGKSTFAAKLYYSIPAAYQATWSYCNQDQLKTRKAVEHHVTLALQIQNNVIVDRCNFDERQRKHWIDLGQKYQVNMILAVVMPSYDDVDLCINRAIERGDSDGCHSQDTNWNLVCNRMCRDFTYPMIIEGFHGIYACQTNKDLDKLITAITSCYPDIIVV
jgi:hypothetical protein